MLLYLSPSSFQVGCSLWQCPHLEQGERNKQTECRVRGCPTHSSAISTGQWGSLILPLHHSRDGIAQLVQNLTPLLTTHQKVPTFFSSGHPNLARYCATSCDSVPADLPLHLCTLAASFPCSLPPATLQYSQFSERARAWLAWNHYILSLTLPPQTHLANSYLSFRFSLGVTSSKKSALTSQAILCPFSSLPLLRLPAIIAPLLFSQVSSTI